MPHDAWDWVRTIALWLAGLRTTACSTLFGVPLWFNALQQLARIRSSGPSPWEAAAARGDGRSVVRAGLQLGAAASPPG
ncbi:hypothetical protein E2C06_02865 [Dankookia rubra]|uniref:Uncharacterized protein n=1 Tax=Dankookia rubra TaxID=1442381 RepID=A0A4R5QLZ6_9PROT|nr:hypothetical protein [Dankookia rubra]TDH64296.1 hypothetical protein E2C06_02865 [Dankookia rubra]